MASILAAGLGMYIFRRKGGSVQKVLSSSSPISSSSSTTTASSTSSIVPSKHGKDEIRMKKLLEGEKK